MNTYGTVLVLALACFGGEKNLILAGEVGNTMGFEEYKECGGVLTISALYATVISYKEGEVYGTSEFCLWTLLAEDNVDPFRMIISQNITEPDYGIVAYFWNDAAQTLTGYQLPRNNTDITFEAPPLFLAFSSGWSPKSEGFRITMPANVGPPSKLRYQAYHVEKHDREFSFPTNDSGKDLYDNMERVSVVVHPVPRDIWKRKKVTLKLSTELDKDCINVYTLRAYAHPDPDLRGKFSGVGTYEFVMENYDPMVFIFWSDEKVTGKGFTIEVKNQQYKEL